MAAGRTLAAAVATAETLRVTREAEGESGADGDGDTTREEPVEAYELQLATCKGLEQTEGAADDDSDTNNGDA